ncbi:hypothetical protein [Pseudomonas bohemica]|uniref:hypothetical protein n=1 Tax=Pseudomonas bohemica TaxID=2044872 RepID=UPI0018FE8D62|nr:hypothetical protein [Pseudomonas bohemica]
MTRLFIVPLFVFTLCAQAHAACLTTNHRYSSGVLAASSTTVVHGPFSVQSGKGCRGIIEVGISQSGKGAKPQVYLEERIGSQWKEKAKVQGASTRIAVHDGVYRVVYRNISVNLASYSGYTKITR